jgi:hypothetical protein
MNPIQEKLIDILVNVISIILGGGIITAVIEWRRHNRERKVWEREDKMLEIDIPRAEMMIRRWEITEDLSSEDKLEIYENKLENKVKAIILEAQFVIRNTTAADIVITSYDANILQIPPGNDNQRYYDLETGDLISVEEIGTIKIRPYASVARIIVMTSYFSKVRILDQVPSTIALETKTSNGIIIRATTNINVVNRIPDLGVYEEKWHPMKYIAKFATDEDIPF